MADGTLEAKAVAGPTVYFIAGYLSSVLITAWPWLRDTLTADQQQTLPYFIGLLFAGTAAWFAPHTHRFDLPLPPNDPRAIPVPVVPAPAEPVVSDVQLPPGKPPPK